MLFMSLYKACIYGSNEKHQKHTYKTTKENCYTKYNVWCLNTTNAAIWWFDWEHAKAILHTSHPQLQAQYILCILYNDSLYLIVCPVLVVCSRKQHKEKYVVLRLHIKFMRRMNPNFVLVFEVLYGFIFNWNAKILC